MLFFKLRRLVLVLLSVIVIQFFELSLLYFKYDIFTGGFLQPFSYKTFSEKLIFITLSCWYDFVLLSCIAGVWFFIADSIKKHGIAIYYNFVFLVLLIIGSWLTLKFKVLSYFSDAINLQIIKNLGGGNLQEALSYASNEIVLFIVFLCVMAIVFKLIIEIFKKIKLQGFFSNHQYEHSSYILPLFIILGITPILSFFISNNDFLRYGLDKKTSYHLIISMLDKLSDIDNDGYGSFSYPKDRAIYDPAIFPGAIDIPGNGIDEDGFLGDAIIVMPEKDKLAQITPKKGKHIILIILESARSELTEKQYDGKYVAPALVKLAQSGTSAKNAYSHTGYTTTSITAIFNRDLVKNNQKIKLVDFLQSAGYQLSIISGQDESFGDVAAKVGMKNEGVYYFDARTAIDERVLPSTDQGSLRLSEERVVKQFKKRLDEVDFNVPQFVYLNFQAAHFPYAHPTMSKRLIEHLIPRSKINAENKEWLTKTYWNAIASADWAVNEVVLTLRDKELLGNTTIAILGDHGESLFDDEFLGHGHAINDSQTKIPLIFNDTNLLVNEAIGQIDVAEMTIRSALDEPNQWQDENKVVFQLVGSLARPTLIAHVGQGGKRILFDFRSEQVFYSDLNIWKSYQEALADPEFRPGIERLIRHWEDLRWREYEADQQ